jgi:glycosyltransferase involved in cell wall biosynthesis
MGSNLRILRVADVFDNRHGGMSRTMYCTGDCLQNAGHQVDYLFHEAFQWKIPRQLQRYLRAWEAAKIIQRRIAGGETWDVIEMHEPLAAAYGLARRRNPALPPLVVFSYGIDSRGYEAMRDYREKKQIPFSLKSRTTATALVWQAAAGVRLASHVICSNQQDVDYLREVRRIPASRLTRHQSGVEAPFMEAGVRISNRPHKKILFMGNWIERKGILDIIPAATAVLDRDSEATFTVAGCNCPGDAILPGFPERLRQRIQVIPHVPDVDSLIRVYSQHAIMLLPSYFEGHPLVMVEAAAMGLAIVTTPICGMLDFITDGVSGMFAPVGDSYGLTAAMDRLLREPEMSERLGHEARNVAKSHTWESAAEKIETAYRGAMEDSSVGKA